MDPSSVILVIFTCGVVAVTASEDEMCYSQGGVAGIVIATFFVTLIVTALAIYAFRYFKNKRSGRHNHSSDDNSTRKVLPESESKYAFDNPYFKDDENEKPTADDAEKGQVGLTVDNNGTILQSNSTTNAVKNKKTKTHPLSSVFYGVKKQRSRDDSCLAIEPERITVPLRGHDFTGLGFNICGNMRDGIFVKDVLHHGPASESGKIRAGDRILSVTVSFNSMVYEDALTILSYASPYNVHLELEKASEKSHVVPTSPGKRLGSVSFRSGGQRLFHPLYRSQSIDDLTQIGKESIPNQELVPKRSQSIGLAANQKPNRPYLRNADSVPEESPEKSSAILRSAASLDEEALNVPTENVLQKSCTSPILTERYIESQNLHDKDEEKAKHTTAPDDVHIVVAAGECAKSESDKDDDKPPQPYPRKGNTPGKRKAPSPPKELHSNSSEIVAQIHHSETSEREGKNEQKHDSVDSGPPEIKKIKDSVDLDSLETASLHEDVDSHSDDSLELAIPEEHKRKSSSLGDLTKLEDITSKKSPTLLERAMSMDLKQESIPDSNLIQQKKILKPPVFDGGDSTETDISAEHNGSVECDLKKWDHNSIEKAKVKDISSFNESINDTLDDSQKNEIDFETASEPSTASHSPTLSISSDTKTTSTPIKKIIQADSLLMTDLSLNKDLNQNGILKENENETHPVIKNFSDNSISVEIPVIPPVIRQVEKKEYPSPPVVFQSYQASAPLQQKEIIEISEKELDNIMMSHKQFLLKQAKATGVYTNLNPDSSKSDPEIEFESWSYTDDDNNTKQTVNGNSNDSSMSHYKTSLEISDLSAPLWKQAELPENDNAPLWKQGDLSREYTVRTSEGELAKTVIVTPGGLSTTDSPPPQL